MHIWTPEIVRPRGPIIDGALRELYRRERRRERARWQHIYDPPVDAYVRQAAIAPVQSNQTAHGSGDVTTIQVTLNGIAAGSLLVGFVHHSNSGTVSSVNDGTSNLTLGTRRENATSTDVVSPCWRLSDSGGTKTFTATVSPASAFMRFTIAEWSYSGTCSLDADAGGSGVTATQPITNTFSTTGTDELVFACTIDNNNSTASAQVINGVTATLLNDIGGHHPFYRILTSTFTNGTAGCTVSGGAGVQWAISALAFTVTAGGPTDAQNAGIFAQQLSGGVIIGRVDA